MAFVEIKLGAGSYRIDCADGQLERLKRLSAMVEERGRALAETGAANSAPEGEDPALRFLLLTALLVADRADQAETALAGLQAKQADIEATAEPAPAGDALSERDAVLETEPAAPRPAGQSAEEGEAQVKTQVKAQAQTESEAELTPELEHALSALFDSAAARLEAAAASLEQV